MKFKHIDFETSLFSFEGVSKTVENSLEIIQDQQNRLMAYQKFMNDARVEYISKIEKFITILNSFGLSVETWSSDSLSCLSGIYFGRSSHDKHEVEDASVLIYLRLNSNKPRKNMNAIKDFILRVQTKVMNEVGWLISINPFSFVDRDEAKTNNLLTEVYIFKTKLSNYGINTKLEVENEN